MDGKEIMRKQLHITSSGHTELLDLRTIQKGMYNLKVIVNGRSYNKKVIKL
jgi:hypothetical protein